MLGKFIAGDFIAIAGEMHRSPASNENTGRKRRRFQHVRGRNRVWYRGTFGSCTGKHR